MAETPAPQKGVLPKNLQTWVLIGVTIVVIAVIALAGSGSKSRSGTGIPVAGATPPAAPKSAADQYAERLQQLTADAERAQQEALAARMAAGFGGLPEPEPGAGTPSEEDELRKLKAQREYSSLFASQLARSYRSEKPTFASTPAPTGISDAPTTYGVQSSDGSGAAPPQDPRLAELDRQSQSLATQEQQLRDLLNPPVQLAPPVPPAPSAGQKPTTARNATVPGAQHYALLEGSLLETALLTRINSDFTGPVVVQTSAPVYTRNVQHVLIPSGSRVIGEAKRTEAFGQTRLVVVFHRLLMPDGFSVDLDQFTGMSPRGESALADQVNHHYLQIFGTSIALGLLGGLSAVGTNPTYPTTLDQFRMGTASSFGQAATHVLDKFTNILPTITIREGHRVRVWISQDLTLPAYDAHAMPKDL